MKSHVNLSPFESRRMAAVKAFPSPQCLAQDLSVIETESDDVDEQAAQLEGWNQDYAQISAGKFFGHMQRIGLSGVSLFVESTNRALLQCGALADDLVALGVPVELPGGAVFCGSRVSDQGVHLFSGDNGFEFFSPPGLVMSGVCVPRSELVSQLTEEEWESVVAKLSHPHWASCDPWALEAMRKYVHHALEVAGGAQGGLENPGMRQLLRESVISNLAQLLVTCSTSCERVQSVQRRWKIVMDAQDFVLSQPDRRTSIAEVCEAVGVSRRTLQYCFQDILGIGPLDFMLSIRLSRAKRMLRTATTVTDAAVHWGFWHFGYFSKHFRTMFGELPSETHKRYHAN
ncbi:MAG: helix-turn-helix domain-containing protein [Burkholderiaceae bacterium]|nr:helix-turn-helix domain-containing protein [Roseateles sp.]MBV8470486.1 helix-turn-helix domain-containing protein [Burkholderiaceae bacterium]